MADIRRQLLFSASHPNLDQNASSNLWTFNDPTKISHETGYKTFQDQELISDFLLYHLNWNLKRPALPMLFSKWLLSSSNETRSRSAYETDFRREYRGEQFIPPHPWYFPHRIIPIL
jgi:hypothetical protein